MGWEMTCKDCAQTFLFEGEEQERYARDGFAPPKRCRPCRAKRRAAHKDPRDDDPPDAPEAPEPPAPPTDKRADGKRWFEAQCGACGVLTQVPFEPTDLRPVYCDTCFQYR